MKHTITCLVKNQPGVLARVTGAFTDKGVNIHSLAVAESSGADVSRMTVVVEAEEGEIDAVEGIADELDEVTAIQDLSADELTARELLLIKVQARPENLPRIMQSAELFRAEVIAVNETTMTLALVSIASRIDGLIRALTPMGIVEAARSGRIAVSNMEVDDGGGAAGVAADA